jgi:hypothetical protein
MVLNEFDANNFEMFSNRTVVQITEDQLALFGPGTKIGDWLKENGTKAQYTTMTNHRSDMHKFVVYADLTDIQQSDYILRFSHL